MVLLVSNDEYELPMAVYDSIHEAANKLRMSPSGISHAIHRGSITAVLGKAKGKFIRLDIPEDKSDA